jgi:hypothetical protein
MNKTSQIGVRFTPLEREALILLARDEERTVSDTLRVIVRREAARRGLWPDGKRSKARLTQEMPNAGANEL